MQRLEILFKKVVYLKALRLLLRDCLPPILLRFVKNLKGNSILLKGDYKTWQEAAALSAGYDAKLILKRCENQHSK